jgi:thermolysin
LTYSGESGALNESWSDVFGAMVERYANGGQETAATWWIGEAAYTPATAGDAMRYMDTPHRAGNYGYTANDDPDHYSERYTGTGDSGGVHINSGIANHVFYLVAKGGNHAHIPGPFVTGIGADAAARIWYKALTTYMTSSTNFAGARTATLNAATDLYGTGSLEYLAVANAWAACGVF